MSFKRDDLDVSDEELDKIINPFYDKYHEFVVTYIMPETIAFYNASSYNRSDNIKLSILSFLSLSSSLNLDSISGHIVLQ